MMLYSFKLFDYIQLPNRKLNRGISKELFPAMLDSSEPDKIEIGSWRNTPLKFSKTLKLSVKNRSHSSEI